MRELKDAIDAEGHHCIEVETVLSSSRDPIKRMIKNDNSA